MSKTNTVSVGTPPDTFLQDLVVKNKTKEKQLEVSVPTGAEGRFAKWVRGERSPRPRQIRGIAGGGEVHISQIENGLTRGEFGEIMAAYPWVEVRPGERRRGGGVARYLGTLEVDQRQRLIHSTDKLREMLAGSWNIGQTVALAQDKAKNHPKVQLVMAVSGVIRAVSEDLDALGRFLWELREQFAADPLYLPASAAIVEHNGCLDPTLKQLEQEIRKVKDARGGEAGEARAPMFVPCNLQPQQFANVWIPERTAAAHRPRRLLASTESYQREIRARETLTEFLERFDTYQAALGTRGNKDDLNPYQIGHLRLGAENGYVALIKADGDGMGRLLINLKWKALGKALGCPAEEAVLRFSTAVDQCLNNALKAAVDEVLQGESLEGKRFPIAPIVAGGEDFWILCRRDLALRLACALGKKYAEMAAADTTLTTALSVAGEALQNERLTLSFGVLFAKEGFPIEHQLELAEELLMGAKNARKAAMEAGATGQGYIDFLWLQSTAREGVEDLRRGGYEYEDGGTTYQLYARPCSLAEMEAQRNISRQVYRGVPSSKWNQLRTILRLGRLSEVAYEDWYLHLTEGQRNSVNEAQTRWRPGHAEFAPWVQAGTTKQTPLVDWIEIAEAES